MRIIPVLDLMSGSVVRGVAGRRSEYQPLVSGLTTSCRPIAVADALSDHFGFTEFYLADLDVIEGGTWSRSLVDDLHCRDLQLWLDAGIQEASQAEIIASSNVKRLVAGLETLHSPAELAKMVQAFGERIVFSLDLRGGLLLGHVERWRSSSAFGLAAQAIEVGVSRILVLDLAQVGVGGGTGTESLCARLAKSFPHVELSAGGGVRGFDDLSRLRDLGVQNVLVASALHDGRLTPEQLARL